MRNIVFISSVLFLVAGFANYGNTHDYDHGSVQEEAVESMPNTKAPNVILLGDLAKVPQDVKAKLPTGYSWRTDQNLDIKIDTGNPDDPRGLFLIKEGITDIDQIMKWSQERGKEEVYLLYDIEIDPNVETQPFFEPLDIIFNYTVERLQLSWEKHIKHFIFIPEAYADNIYPPLGYCVPPVIVPAGACFNNTFPDDNPGDGQIPSIQLCFMACSMYWHYTLRMQTHMMNNLVDYQSGNVRSQVDCLKNVHGAGWIKNPVNLRIELYINAVDTRNAVCAVYPGGGCCGSSGVAGCAEIGPKTTPRTTYNRRMWISDLQERNNWNVSRHEIMHSYGYTDAQTAVDLDQSDSCRASQYIYY